MRAERPTMDTINAIIFPTADINTKNITTSIEISEDAVRCIFNAAEGWWCSIIGTFLLTNYT